MDENVDYKKYEEYYNEDNFWKKTTQFAKKAGVKVVYTALKLYFALKSNKTPAWAKSVIIGALGYFILPIDLVPDLVPVAGFTDDLGVLLAAIGTVALHITPEVTNAAKEKIKEWYSQLRRLVLNRGEELYENSTVRDLTGVTNGTKVENIATKYWQFINSVNKKFR